MNDDTTHTETGHDEADKPADTLSTNVEPTYEHVVDLEHTDAHIDPATSSLQAALKQLKEQAMALQDLPVEQRIESADKLADAAARLDEQIGSLARNDDA